MPTNCEQWLIDNPQPTPTPTGAVPSPCMPIGSETYCVKITTYDTPGCTGSITDEVLRCVGTSRFRPFCHDSKRYEILGGPWWGHQHCLEMGCSSLFHIRQYLPGYGCALMEGFVDRNWEDSVYSGPMYGTWNTNTPPDCGETQTGAASLIEQTDGLGGYRWAYTVTGDLYFPEGETYSPGRHFPPQGTFVRPGGGSVIVVTAVFV